MDNTNQLIETYKDDPSKMLFWHGGNLQDTIKTEYKKGRYEFGPGLYAITNYTSAKKYSKGSRRLYLLVIDKGTDLKSAYLDQPVVEEFVKNNVVGKLQKEVFDRLSKYIKDGKIKAYLLNNILLNLDAIRGSNVENLRQFFVNNGIDYEIVSNPFGWGEHMIVLYNMKKIVKSSVVDPKEKLDVFDLPSINESHFMTFLDKLQTTYNKSLIESIKLGFNTLFESVIGPVYHGSGTSIDSFSYEFTDSGVDALGSGFYFTTSIDEASVYTKSKNHQNKKLVDGDRPTVHVAELDIKKPLSADAVGSITKKQVIKFLKRSPILKQALENFGDIQHEGFANVFNNAVETYITEDENIVKSLFTIANDFYKGHVKEFNKAIYDILGYDGVYDDFGDKTHYVAFFPEQIKILDRKPI